MNTSATERFLTGPHCVRNARAYVAKRHEDATLLLREMHFRFFTEGIQRCEVYEHIIHLGVVDYALTSRAPAGCGNLYIRGHDDARYPFTNIVQALAYILQSNW